MEAFDRAHRPGSAFGPSISYWTSAWTGGISCGLPTISIRSAGFSTNASSGMSDRMAPRRVPRSRRRDGEAVRRRLRRHRVWPGNSCRRYEIIAMAHGSQRMEDIGIETGSIDFSILVPITCVREFSRCPVAASKRWTAAGSGVRAAWPRGAPRPARGIRRRSSARRAWRTPASPSPSAR